MDSSTSLEYNSLINELTQGREGALQLKLHLSSTSLAEPQDLVQKICSSFEKSLLILKWCGPLVQSRPPAHPNSAALESSLSVDGSPCSDDLSKKAPAYNECNNSLSKKRKRRRTWTEQVRINHHTGLEGPGDDGYIWRKYGQKDILGTKYPRSYYRCTYRQTHNCWANKQVQRSDDDPYVFELTYKGTHTCTPASKSAPPRPTLTKKQELKHNYHQHINNESVQPDEMLMHLRANLRVKTADLQTIKEERSPFSAPPTFSSMSGENHECSHPILPANNHRFLGTCTPSFISPGSSESDYFSASSCHMNEFGNFPDWNYLESVEDGIFSANASSTNSPIASFEYLLDPVALDSNFPFVTSENFLMNHPESYLE